MLATPPWEARRALGIKRRRLTPVDQAALARPDSAICREAEQLVAERTSAMVANHSHRTYVWGAALATLDGLSYDREVVYVAALLHDLYAETPDVLPYPYFFTLPEADKAQELGRRGRLG